MCGIAGIVSNKGRIVQGELRKMTQTIIHRGPDGEGHWVNDDQTVGFGHRRLSIIDLSDHGKQPMHFQERYVITFNGEIYNYIEIKNDLIKKGVKFKTDTDTEVLLAAYSLYGEKCLELLDGMFAFAIYDKQNRKIFCARDRFGEKPFYYSFIDGKFCFGSEMKELWAISISKTINRKVLYNYLNTGNAKSDIPEETFYENICELKLSHYLSFSINDINLDQTRYWDIDTTRQNDISRNDAVESFVEIMNVSVKRRLRSDVPVGSSLSGGLDSSIIVKTISEQNTRQKLKTFSAIFPGFVRNEQEYQHIVSQLIGSDHYEVYPSPEKNIENFDKVLYHQEMPFGSASINAQFEVFKLARANDITVMMDGQGADEFLSGYKMSTSFYLRELLSKGNLSTYISEGFNSIKNQRNSISNTFGKSVAHLVPQTLLKRFDKNSYLNNQKWINQDLNEEYKSYTVKKRPYFKTLNESLKYQSLDSGLETLLRYSDRNAMANSIEVRLPFLSHELVEFVFSLPPEFKIYKGWTKWLARAAYDAKLPESIIWRKEKVGYESSDNHFYRQKGNPSVKETVQNSITEEYFIGDISEYSPAMFWRRFMIGKILDSK